jgi:hypothetical protein
MQLKNLKQNITKSNALKPYTLAPNTHTHSFTYSLYKDLETFFLGTSSDLYVIGARFEFVSSKTDNPDRFFFPSL